ncbi:hypothetical protein HCG51_15190 [Tolypothrix sp. PCC 7910]|uniref:hypothetical protein n=1 Tax=Tolypothrix sp. PCC 7910 TaxID=2099387 RepID=UPI0014279EC0|nr:hypothetical protein [Tolypothrix sp. PCC 7910]QIR37920.1 hypothetical protein HCG51_15190 [Tolypothrix sp. PCC 7910]
MPIYGPDKINFAGVNGDRYWFYEPYPYTGIADIDERLSGFPVAVFLPPHCPLQQTPLVIGLQGMSAPYGWNAFIVPTLTQMGIAVALFDTPFAGERSLVRTFTAKIQNACAEKFPDGACYAVPGMGHGTRQWGPGFVDHVRYFLTTQLGDWQS